MAVGKAGKGRTELGTLNPNKVGLFYQGRSKAWILGARTGSAPFPFANACTLQMIMTML